MLASPSRLPVSNEALRRPKEMISLSPKGVLLGW